MGLFSKKKGEDVEKGSTSLTKAQSGDKYGSDMTAVTPSSSSNNNNNSSTSTSNRDKEKEKDFENSGPICFEFVIVFDIGKDDARLTILKNLRSAGLVFEQIKSRDEDEYLIRVGCYESRLLAEAEKMELEFELKDNEKGQPEGFAKFTVENKSKFRESNEDPRFFFRSSKRQQVINHIITSPHTEGGAEIDIGKLVCNAKVKAFFPMHYKPVLEDLQKRWAGGQRSQLRFWEQPLDDVAAYFGEAPALYFAWLGFYTKMLITPAFFGLITFLVQLGTNVDSPIVVVYSILLAVWSTLFLEYWKRNQATLAFKWNTTGTEDEEPARPAFKGTPKEDPITGKMVLEYPAFRRLLKYLCSLPIIGAMLTMVIIATLGILVFRLVMQQTSGLATAGPLIAGGVNAVSIIILDTIYLMVAKRLNDWENHKTQTQYDDSLIAKNFCFQFINSFSSLFYIAFAKPTKPTFWGETDQCLTNCMDELQLSLASMLVTRMVVQQAVEVSTPWIKTQIRRKMEDRAMAERSAKMTDAQKSNIAPLTPEEEQSKMEVYTGTFDDFNEMVIQFGYVTLFASAFPLAAVLALLNNMFEIRGDALKLCSGYQRPLYRAAEDIGTYYYILEAMSTMAVVTNALIIAFTSTQLDRIVSDPWQDTAQTLTAAKLGIAVVAEHIILLFKFLVASAIPDVPEDIANLIKLTQYNQKVTLMTADKKKEEQRLLQLWEKKMSEPYDYDKLEDAKNWVNK